MSEKGQPEGERLIELPIVFVPPVAANVPYGGVPAIEAPTSPHTFRRSADRPRSKPEFLRDLTISVWNALHVIARDQSIRLWHGIASIDIVGKEHPLRKNAVIMAVIATLAVSSVYGTGIEKSWRGVLPTEELPVPDTLPGLNALAVGAEGAGDDTVQDPQAVVSEAVTQPTTESTPANKATKTPEPPKSPAQKVVPVPPVLPSGGVKSLLPQESPQPAPEKTTPAARQSPPAAATAPQPRTSETQPAAKPTPTEKAPDWSTREKYLGIDHFPRSSQHVERFIKWVWDNNPKLNDNGMRPEYYDEFAAFVVSAGFYASAWSPNLTRESKSTRMGYLGSKFDVVEPDYTDELLAKLGYDLDQMSQRKDISDGQKQTSYHVAMVGIAARESYEGVMKALGIYLKGKNFHRLTTAERHGAMAYAFANAPKHMPSISSDSNALASIRELFKDTQRARVDQKLSGEHANLQRKPIYQERIRSAEATLDKYKFSLDKIAW